MVQIFITKNKDVEVYHQGEDMVPEISKEEMKSWIAEEMEKNDSEMEFGDLYESMREEHGIKTTTLFSVSLEEMVKEDGEIIATSGYEELTYIG